MEFTNGYQCNGWVRWNKNVTKAKILGPITTPLSPGTKFKWTSGASISSMIEEVVVHKKITWSDKTIGIKTRHTFIFEETSQGTYVTTHTSFQGFLVTVFPKSIGNILMISLSDRLDSLRTAAQGYENS